MLIDDFLEEDLAGELLAEFPSMDDMARSNDYMFGDKRQQAMLAPAGPASRQYRDLLMSAEFAGLLSEITGRTLFMDPDFHGGGFHQSGDGGFLDTHVDFNIHPDHKDWLRVLNVLLYLNKDWPAEYGGSLLIRTGPKDEPRAIAPLFNRCVMMLTSDNTYHRFRKMSLPPDRTRKSIAGYAYELIDEGSRKARTTSWAPEDGGGRKAGSCPALGQPGRRQEQADRQEGRVAGAPVMSSRLPILRTTFLGIRRVFLSETPTIGTG